MSIDAHEYQALARAVRKARTDHERERSMSAEARDAGALAIQRLVDHLCDELQALDSSFFPAAFKNACAVE